MAKLAAAQTLRRLHRPWEGKDLETKLTDEYSRLRQAYVERIGDPADPAHKREIQAGWEAWQREKQA